MNTTTYITTTIPYVNSRPHVGFALELVQADAIARYRRAIGETVHFQTGTDDNALSNVLSAQNAEAPVAEFVDTNSGAFRDLCRTLGVSIDHFVRTSEHEHHEAVRHFLSRLRDDDTYIASYKGLYCPRCEDFYLDRDVPSRTCPEHGIELDEVEENNHFFRLSRYQEQLRDLIASGRLKIVPQVREAEVLRFIERGLRDFSISRSAARSGGWGVRFPSDEEQVVYVWVDALINYISGLGYPDGEGFSTFWSRSTRRLHVIGKNVWKFHAVYWPALLLSAGLDLPSEILVHGFLTERGKKISKSSGNATDPEEFVAAFGADALRYYLLAHARPYEDTDFTSERLAEIYRTDLANTLGNLCSRLTALCERAQIQGVSIEDPPPPSGYREHFEQHRFDQAAAAIWRELDRLNQEIAHERPWDALKHAATPAIKERLRTWAAELYAIAYWLGPFLPSTSARLREQLAAPSIRKSEPLFPR